LAAIIYCLLLHSSDWILIGFFFLIDLISLQALTDSHSRDIGDYDALVIVQLSGFEEGELLLYERLQMTSMLLERYAADGSEKSRRRMLAMCQTDPEILADVLSHFVAMASEKLKIDHSVSYTKRETNFNYIFRTNLFTLLTEFIFSRSHKMDENR
jgi:hypothetical protein